MAGLALIFALALEKEVQPHMILLDEVDAHLDEDNVNLLTKFIEEMKSQVLMISHKVSAVSTCSSLIGVTQQDYYRSMNDEV